MFTFLCYAGEFTFYDDDEEKHNVDFCCAKKKD